MVANSLGQCRQDLLQFLWNLADHYAQTMLGFWMKILLSLQHRLPSKQQTIVNSKNTIKIVMFLRRHNHSSLWNYFQLDLFPTVHQNCDQTD